MSTPPNHLPIDETSRARLAQTGLTFAPTDRSDRAAYEHWHRTVARGFLDAESTDEEIDQAQRSNRGSRLIGVHDPTSPDPAAPVATSESWIAALTVPGGSSSPAWAISDVTVAPTHRRRGIARALLEAELRTAAAAGMSMAMLTVSESTIYARFGFSPAAMARNVTIDTRRVRWSGPKTTGQIHYVTAEQLRDDGHAIIERVRLQTPGQIEYNASSEMWQRQIGIGVDAETAKHLRLVRHDDADGEPQGFAVYSTIKNPTDLAESTVTLKALVGATPEAYAALWQFMLEMDLISTVKASLRPVDEPLRWMIGDFRAMHVDEYDHLWTRILDVPAALSARTYAVRDRLVLRVTDPLGFATGTWAVDVGGDGAAEVTPCSEDPDAMLTVNALSSLHLGGVSARALVASGSIHGDADRLDTMFRSPVQPYTSIWF